MEAGAVNAIGDHGDGGEDGAAVGGADGGADGGANDGAHDGAVSDLEKQIQSFNEAPEGHLAFVKEKIEPLLMKGSKAKLLARDNPGHFVPPRPKAGTNGVWYHGAMATDLWSPHHFSKTQEEEEATFRL